MKKSDELLQAMNGLKKELDAMQVAEEHDAYNKKAKEYFDVAEAYKNAKRVEDMDAESFKEHSKPEKAANVDEKKMRNRVFNKLVLGRPLDDAEREFVNVAGTPGQVEATPGKGGYLVPEEQIAQIREYRKAYTALKPYCAVHTAGSTSGVMPTLGDENGTLTAFDELNEITQSDFDFGQLRYSIKDYGDIIPVSNQLLQDADVNLMDIIGQRFARKAVNTENAQILALLDKLTSTSIADYKGLMKALNVDLDPSYYANARIFTNQDGFQWMSELEDGQKRPLLVPDVAAPDTYRFRGKEVVVLSNNTLKSNTTKKTIPVYIGSLSDYAAFFQRLGVEVAVSQEAGFTKYATYLRAVERFGVVADDTDALKSYTISTATA